MAVATDASAFSGQWEDDDGTTLTIEGTTMTDPFGVQAELIIKSREVCVFQVGNELCEGRLNADAGRIVWSDGAVWLRQPAAVVPKKATDRSEEAEQPAEPPTESPAGKEQAAGLPEAAAGKPVLALEQVLKLQEELRCGFAEESFQRKLRQLEARCGKACDKYTLEHTALFQTVQNAILPKFGFETGQKGVVDMLEVGAAFNDDPQYRENRLALNKLLGLVSAEDERHATRQREHAQASEVTVLVRHYFDGTEMQVVVPKDATFRRLKEAISSRTGRPDVLERGHLVRKEHGIYSAYRDSDALGQVGTVFLVRAPLEVHNDEEAKAWRQRLAEGVHAVVPPLAATVAGGDAQGATPGTYSSRAWADIKPGPQSKGPPFGACYLVGSWDDYRGRREMTWDGHAYRCHVHVREMEDEESFQVLAGGTGWDSRIYPSVSDAGPSVPHRVMGPDDKGHGLNWTMAGVKPGARYEVVLNCQRGRPVAMSWSKDVTSALQGLRR